MDEDEDDDGGYPAGPAPDRMQGTPDSGGDQNWGPPADLSQSADFRGFGAPGNDFIPPDPNFDQQGGGAVSLSGWDQRNGGQGVNYYDPNNGGFQNPMAGRVNPVTGAPVNVGVGYGFQQVGNTGSFTGSGTFGGGYGGGGGGRGRGGYAGGYAGYINDLQRMADLSEQYGNRSQGVSQDMTSRGLQNSTVAENSQVMNQRSADIAANAVRRHGNSALAAQDIASEYNQIGAKLFGDLKARGISDPGTVRLYTQRLQQEYLAAVRRLGPGTSGALGGGGYGGGGGGGGYRIPMAAYGNYGGGSTDGSQGYFIPNQAFGGA